MRQQPEGSNAPDPPSPAPPAVEELLRRLWLNDQRTVRAVLAGEPTEVATLDRRSEALVQLTALLASGAAAASCRVAVERARGARVSDDELVGVLVAIAPALGAARLVAAVPTLALAIDFDVEDGDV